MHNSKIFVLNPVWIVFLLYFSSNTFYFLKGFYSSGFTLLDAVYVIESEFYVVAYLSIVMFLFFILLFYLYAVKRNVKSDCFFLDGLKSNLLLFYIAIYFLFVLFTGSDVVGGERDFSIPGSLYLNYFFKVINPDLVAIAGLPLIRSSRLFYIGLGLFLLSMMLRGWMGGFYIGGLVYLVRFYPVFVSYRLVVFFILFLFLLPFLNSLKWGIRGGYDVVDILSLAYENYTFESFLFALESVFERFQHVNNVALIFYNGSFLSDAFFEGGFRPFWVNGFLADIYCNVTKDCHLDLNAFLVNYFYEPGEGRKWNVDPGLAGWFLINPVISISVFLFFIFLGLFFPYLIYRFYSLRLYHISIVCSYIYFFHGWFAPYINFLFVLLLMVFFSKARLYKH